MSVACGWRHTMAIGAKNVLYVWGHTMGYDFQGRGDLVDDETQAESLVPRRLYVSEIPGRFPVRVATTFAQNMSVSTLTIRQDQTETAMGLKRKVKFSKEGKSLERDLALRLLEDSTHAGDAEVQFKRGKIATPVKERKPLSLSPQAQALRSIKKAEIDKMGRQQLQSLVQMLKEEDTTPQQSGFSDTTGPSYMRSTASNLAGHRKRQQAAGSSKQPMYREHASGAEGIKETSQERGWQRGGHAAPLVDERVDGADVESLRYKQSRAARSGINSRTRWWRGKQQQREHNALVRQRRLKDAARAVPAASSRAAAEPEPEAEDSKDAAGGLREEDIGALFAQGLLLPQRGPVTDTRDKNTKPLDLFIKYKGQPAAESKKEPVVKNVAKGFNTYFGRTDAEKAEVHRSIKQQVYSGVVQRDDPELLMSSRQNLGSVHSRAYYKNILLQKEKEEQITALAAARRQSTWENDQARRAKEADNEYRAAAERQAREEQRNRLEKEQRELREQLVAARRSQREDQARKSNVQSSMDAIKAAVNAQNEQEWDSGFY